MPLLLALWAAFRAFLARLFRRNTHRPSPSLPPPVTATTTFSAKEPTPLKRAASAASSPSPPPTAHIFHPPPSPFSNLSLSGIFATPPLAPDMELGQLSLASPPDVPFLASVRSPETPSPLRDPQSLHSIHSSPRTPSTPSSPVMVVLDRSAFSPTTMSDGSLEIISLGDRRGFAGPPLVLADASRLPSPWSPTMTISSGVWMTVDGLLVNATGPVDDDPSQDVSPVAMRTIVLSPLPMPRISTTSLYSSTSALDSFGISVFVELDEVGDVSPSQGNHVDIRDDPIPKLNQVCDENHATLVTPELQTPRKRRETIPSVAKSGAFSHSARTTKCFSTPLTKLDNVDISHVRSTSSISSMTYELRLGLFADGRSMTTIQNFICLLDQASPESLSLHNDALQTVEVV